MSRVRAQFDEHSQNDVESPLEPAMGQRGRTVLWMALLATLALLAGAWGLGGEYLAGDRPRVADNPMIKTWAGIKPVWRLAHQSPDFSPLSYTMFLVESRAWKLDRPASSSGYRAVNLLLHVASVLLLYHLLSRIGVPGAVAAAAAFAVHPANISAVSMISLRPSVLGTLLATATLTVLLRIVAVNRRPEREGGLGLPESAGWLWLLVAGLWMLTLAASPALAAAIGPVALIITWWIRGLTAGDWKKLSPPLVMTALVATGAVAMTARSGSDSWYLAGTSLLTRPLAATQQLVLYAAAVVVPWRYRYGYPPMALGVVSYACAALVLLAAGLAVSRRAGRGLAACALVFFVLILPALIWVKPAAPLDGWIAIPRLYPASVAIIVGIVVTACTVLARSAGTGGRLATPLACGAIAILLVGGAIRASTHRSEQSLWEDDLSKGGGAAASVRLARIEMNRKRPEFAKALTYLTDAVRREPSSVDAWIQLGLVQEAQRDYQRAIGSYLRAVALDGKSFDAAYGLARCRSLAGDSVGALKDYQKLTEMQPRNAQVYSDIGMIRFERGELDLSEQAYKTAIAIDPRCAPARINYATLHYRLGRVSEAVAELTYVFEKIDPDRWDVYMNVGALLGQMKEYPKAAIVLRRAVALGGDQPAAHSNLGMALLGWAQDPATPSIERLSLLREAKRRFDRAAELDPGDPNHAANAAGVDQVIRRLERPRGE